MRILIYDFVNKMDYYKCLALSDLAANLIRKGFNVYTKFFHGEAKRDSFLEVRIFTLDEFIKLVKYIEGLYQSSVIQIRSGYTDEFGMVTELIIKE